MSILHSSLISLPHTFLKFVMHSQNISFKNYFQLPTGFSIISSITSSDHSFASHLRTPAPFDLSLSLSLPTNIHTHTHTPNNTYPHNMCAGIATIWLLLCGELSSPELGTVGRKPCCIPWQKIGLPKFFSNFHSYLLTGYFFFLATPSCFNKVKQLC